MDVSELSLNDWNFNYSRWTLKTYNVKRKQVKEGDEQDIFLFLVQKEKNKHSNKVTICRKARE